LRDKHEKSIITPIHHNPKLLDEISFQNKSMDLNRLKKHNSVPRPYKTKLQLIPDHISIVRNLLVKTTDNIIKQNDLITSFQQTVLDNVNILQTLQTLKTAEDVSMNKTNIEFTQTSEIKSDLSSKRKIMSNNLEPIANHNTSVTKSIIFETKK